jgi:hypothetical protein
MGKFCDYKTYNFIKQNSDLNTDLKLHNNRISSLPRLKSDEPFEVFGTMIQKTITNLPSALSFNRPTSRSPSSSSVTLQNQLKTIPNFDQNQNLPIHSLYSLHKVCRNCYECMYLVHQKVREDVREIKCNTDKRKKRKEGRRKVV